MDEIETRDDESTITSSRFQNDDDDGGELNPLKLYRPFFAEYAINAEFNLFSQQNLPGIYCVPTAADAFEWFGVFFLRQGIYQGAILRFTLKLPPDFPETEIPPSLIFEIPVFHPDISADTGELNIKRAFHAWKCGIHHIYQVLIYMQRCFFAVDCTEPVLNAEASRLYKEDMAKYCEKASDSVRRSRELVYDPPQSADANAIRFTPWDQTVHEPVRARILKSSRHATIQTSPGSVSSLSLSSSSTSLGQFRNYGNGIRSKGLSFFDERTFNIMAKDKSWPTTPIPFSVALYSRAVDGDQTKKGTKSTSKSRVT